MFKKLLGIFLYTILRRITLQFIFPSRLSLWIERLRVFSLTLQGAQIGRNSFVRAGVFIAYPQNLILGDNVVLGYSSRIYNYSKVCIGSNSEIGPNAHIQTNDHLWNNINHPIAKQGVFTRETLIGEGVFIGSNVIILQGVRIHDLCVVGAGSIVTRDLLSGYLYCGSPAKMIKPLVPKKLNHD